MINRSSKKLATNFFFSRLIDESTKCGSSSRFLSDILYTVWNNRLYRCPLRALKCQKQHVTTLYDVTEASCLSPHLVYGKSAATCLISQWQQQRNYSLSPAKQSRAGIYQPDSLHTASLKWDMVISVQQRLIRRLDMFHRGHISGYPPTLLHRCGLFTRQSQTLQDLLLCVWSSIFCMCCRYRPQPEGE